MPSLTWFVHAVSRLRSKKSEWWSQQAAAWDFKGFLTLVESEDVAAVRDRLSKAPSLAKYQIGADEETALMRAVRTGNMECVEALRPLSDVQARDAHGETVLMMASRLGNVECLRLLIQQSDLNAIDPELSMPALGIASFYGHTECVDVLLQALRSQLALASVEEPSGEKPSGWARPHKDAKEWSSTSMAHDLFHKNVHQAAHRAAYNGNTECLALLLRECREWLEPNVALPLDDTLLMSAALRGNIDCLRLLLPLGGIHLRNQKGQTALMLAGVNEGEECLRLLLPSSDVDLRDHEGLRAFDHCLKEEKWGHADLLVSKMSLIEARELLRRASNDRSEISLPNSWAMIEKEELGCALALGTLKRADEQVSMPSDSALPAAKIKRNNRL